LAAAPGGAQGEAGAGEVLLRRNPEKAAATLEQLKGDADGALGDDRAEIESRVPQETACPWR